MCTRTTLALLKDLFRGFCQVQVTSTNEAWGLSNMAILKIAPLNGASTAFTRQTYHTDIKPFNQHKYNGAPRSRLTRWCKSPKFSLDLGKPELRKQSKRQKLHLVASLSITSHERPQEMLTLLSSNSFSRTNKRTLRLDCFPQWTCTKVKTEVCTSAVKCLCRQTKARSHTQLSTAVVSKYFHSHSPPTKPEQYNLHEGRIYCKVSQINCQPCARSQK